MSEHAPPRGLRRHMGTPVEIWKQRWREQVQWIQPAALLPCTIPPCKFPSSCRSLQQPARRYRFLSPLQPVLPRGLNAPFYFPHFLKQEEREKKPGCASSTSPSLFPSSLLLFAPHLSAASRAGIQLPSQSQPTRTAAVAAVVLMTAMLYSPAEDSVFSMSFIRCPNHLSVSFIKSLYQTATGSC